MKIHGRETSVPFRAEAGVMMYVVSVRKPPVIVSTPPLEDISSYSTSKAFHCMSGANHTYSTPYYC